VDRVLRPGLGNRRARLVLIAAVVALVVLAAAAMVTERGDRASANEPQAKGPPGLGIDLVHCPKADPEELPPDALAGAVEAALDHVPSRDVIAYIDGKARTTEGAYASSAYLTGDGGASRPGIIREMCRERPQYAKRLLDRSVEVNIVFPDAFPSASLSQHAVYVAKFEGEYRVYAIGH
jgi:hypothetical protein